MRLSKTARRLLALIWDLQQLTGWCTARQAVLARMMDVDTRTVKRCLGTLQDTACIQVLTQTATARKRCNQMRTTSAEIVHEASKISNSQEYNVYWGSHAASHEQRSVLAADGAAEETGGLRVADSDAGAPAAGDDFFDTQSWGDDIDGVDAGDQAGHDADRGV